MLFFLGLNLTIANHVIFLEPGYNPGLELQAIGRCWRIGQKKTVYVTKLILKNTIESKLIKLQTSKLKMNEKFGFQNLKQKVKLSNNDFQFLFDFKQL